jgi:hypothetical protein
MKKFVGNSVPFEIIIVPLGYGDNSGIEPHALKGSTFQRGVVILPQR